MNWLETKVIYKPKNSDKLYSELISNIFYDLGLSGVIVETPEENSGSDDCLDANNNFGEIWDEKLLSDCKDFSIAGYLSINKNIVATRNLFEEKLYKFKDDLNYLILYKRVCDQDWEQSWKKYFWPEKITNKITVKPTWRNYTPLYNDEIIIELDPGMAFGTGTHPTTFMCMNLIEKYLKPKAKLLDIGCGSGILMITAAKLGAKNLLGIDADCDAVDVAKFNLELNNTDKNIYSVTTGNLADEIEGKFDIVVANILSHIIVTLLDNVIKNIKKNGLFICSGISSNNQNFVFKKLKETGFDLVETKIKEDWVSIVAKIKKSKID